MALWAKAQKDKIPLDHGLLYKDGDLATQEQLGISKGGGEFEMTTNKRKIEADGLQGNTKGYEIIDSIDALLKCELMNVSLDMLYLAMPYATMTGSAGSYTKLVIDSSSLGVVEDTSYFENITMCAKTVEGKYVKIKMVNVMNTGDFAFSAKPKEEGSIAFEFTAHWDATDDTTELVEITYVDALPTPAA